MANLAIKMFTATDKYPGHAQYTAEKKANGYLETIAADRVVSVQMQQSTYRDTDGDYPQDMFWYTLLVTVRVGSEVDDSALIAAADDLFLDSDEYPGDEEAHEWVANHRE